MRRLLVALLAAPLALGACGGSQEQTLGEYCVERFEALYRGYGLLDAVQEDLTAECDRFIVTEGLTTRADIDAYARIADDMLREFGS